MKAMAWGFLALVSGLAGYGSTAQAAQGPKTDEARFVPLSGSANPLQGQDAGPLKPLPEGDGGIAAKYPGDVGIDKDPKVIFADNFEEGTTEDHRAKKRKWKYVTNPLNQSLVSAGEKDQHVASGKQALRILKHTAVDTGAGNYMPLKPGFDTVHARFYVRFAEDVQKISHFVWLMAEKGSPKAPMIQAGVIPNGATRFQTALEPLCYAEQWATTGKDAPVWHMYTYWHKMKGNYGTFFNPKPQAVLEQGKWMCMELMLKANSAPDVADGEQAIWKDGKLVGRWGGIDWRRTNDLKINGFFLDVYSGFEKGKQDHMPRVESRVWFDDVVVAQEYIGPRREPKSAKNKKP